MQDSKKIRWLISLLGSLLLLAACTTTTSNITPKEDCLPDVPCVPCILPIPYYPVTATEAITTPEPK